MMADELFADRYRLEGRLGVGGMSTVRLAFDTRLERYVAVKLLAEHLAEDASFVSRFRREALAAARLVHPNVVQVFDYGLDDETHRNFIVMEHVDGHSCAELLKEHDVLDPRDAVEILEQACRGLDYAHRNGVVHRDVKPGNLLRSHEGVVKLADFGIAKAAEDSEITKAGSVLGTAAYLSPEQARGEKAGPPADLYALGVVSYQLLTGRLPYEAASLTDLARMQESGPPLSPSDVDADIPRELGEAVMRALHPLPEGRYEGALEMGDALRDGLRGVAPEPTDATVALDSTSATQMLGDTSATRARAGTSSRPAQRTRRPLEPIDEPARRREPARRASVAPPVEPRRAERKRRNPLRYLFTLVVLLGIVVLGVLTYQLVQDSSKRAVQLREDVRGNVQDAVDEVKGLIEDNTR
jgi:eukaryotic-like serine/threonine-protein kinase